MTQMIKARIYGLREFPILKIQAAKYLLSYLSYFWNGYKYMGSLTM